MNLHPYDSVERRFRHSDIDQAEGRAIVAQMLHLATLPPDGVLYDLSFYSGGIGKRKYGSWEPGLLPLEGM